MKRISLLLGVMLMGTCPLLISCVDSDMYEVYDDGTEFFFPRKKGVKDTGGQLDGSINCYPNVPGYHRIVNAISGYCNQRSLSCKWGTAWYDKIYGVISDIVNNYPPDDQQTVADRYTFPNNVTQAVLNMECWDVSITARIMGKMGFSVNQGGCVGNFYTIKGLSPTTHTVYIVSQGSGSESNCYVDMDGNVWGIGALELLAPQ